MVLIIGATGFIGMYTTQAFLKSWKTGNCDWKK